MVENKEVKTAGSNGNDPEMDEKKLKGWLGAGDFDGVFQSSGVPSAIEKFVEAGKDYPDMALRADFRNDAHVNKTVILYALAEKRHHTALKEAIMNVVAGRPSIGGKRIEILLKAVVGQLQQDERKGGMSKLRQMLLGTRPEDKQK